MWRRGARVIADRQLDETIRRFGQHKGQHQPHDQQRDRVEARSLLVEDHVDRPVKDIDTVRDLPEPDEWRGGQHTAKRARRLQPEHQPCRRERNERQCTVIGGPARLRERHDADEQSGQRDRGKPGVPTVNRTPRQHDRQQRSYQDLADPGRGRPVDRVRSPHQSDHRGTGAEHGCHHADRDRPRACRAASAQDDDHRRWPDPVELLLDRQRPEMLERRYRTARVREQLLVRPAAGEEHPVGDLQHRTDHIVAQIGDAIEHIGDGADDHHQGETRSACRQQPADSSAVEVTKGDPTRGVVLADQQGRDQVARQCEEHRHAEIAAVEPGHLGVEQQDDHHGHCADSVERRLVCDRATLGHASRECMGGPRYGL